MAPEAIKGYIFDLDGVVWDGDRSIPHAVERVNGIIASGKKVIFLTNNSMRSRGTYVKRLKEFGIETTKEHIIVSSYAAGIYINEIGGPSKVYAIGTEDMKAELREAGHTIVDRGADYVVVGLDKTVDYDKMSKGLMNLLGGAKLIACAPDVTFLENGVIKMGTGAFVKGLEAASGKQATTMGKPSKIIMDIAKRVMGLMPGECMVVGDKLETEILAGKREGMKTALVLTGETTRKEARESEIKPDYIIKDLRELP